MTIHLLSAQLARLVDALKGECQENRVAIIEQTLRAAGYVIGDVTPDAKRMAALLCWVDRERQKNEHGCLTGDCPHQKQSECYAALVQDYLEFVQEQDKPADFDSGRVGTCSEPAAASKQSTAPAATQQ